MDFVAIDFETANAQRTSACSIGLVRVRNGAVEERFESLISPAPNYFSAFNTSIHGIDSRMVKKAPTFAELWPELKDYIDGKLLVAHNASFDISVLRRTLEYYDIPVPDFEFLCTYRLAKVAYPNAGAHRLNIIASLIGVELQHHNALSDAEACANILLNMCRVQSLASIADAVRHYDIVLGRNDRYGYRPCNAYGQSGRTVQKNIDDVHTCYADDDFCNRNFVFTGTAFEYDPRQGNGNSEDRWG